MNSLYSFDNPHSSCDCGDWVCWQCEQELMIDAFDLAENGYSAGVAWCDGDCKIFALGLVGDGGTDVVGGCRVFSGAID